jgi:general secretion pathway protein F
MPLYFYKAVTLEGETIEAQSEARDEQALVVQLQREGMLPIRVTLASSNPLSWWRMRRYRSKLGLKDIVLFTHELLTLLQAGLPLDRALTVLLELTQEQKDLNAMIMRILESVKGGAQLSEALEAQSGVFSRFYLNLIRAGEASGALDQVLSRLSEYLERTRELRETVGTAMVYPAILLTMSALSLLLLLTFVVPQFTEMFEAPARNCLFQRKLLSAWLPGCATFGGLCRCWAWDL